ncbi:HBS1-like protein, partial [Habropoda laboriosa]
MSRHRDVRCMNYSEEYEGYDDVYGHSVEDDYCVSPSAEQFLFDRSKQQNIASFITEPDIIEDNEDSEESPISANKEDIALTELERAKLMSCLDSIKNVIGDTVSESEIKKKIIQSNFDAEIALNSILKESSPKNVSGIIENEDTCFAHNLESFKNLSISNSPMSFPSLSGFTTNHVDSIVSNSTKDFFKNNSDTVSFKSLADLTAHHLQKSSTLIDRTNSNGKTFSPNTNFVIPKLSIKNDSCSDLSNIQLGLSTIQKNINLQFDIANDRKKDDSMDSLERSISNLLALSKDCTNSSTKNNSQYVETKENSVLNVSGNRTPSPDPWMIDLSSALKEATSAVSNSCSHTNPKAVEDANNVTPNLN